MFSPSAWLYNCSIGSKAEDFVESFVENLSLVEGLSLVKGLNLIEGLDLVESLVGDFTTFGALEGFEDLKDCKI